jgi:hypothetical protein
VVFLDHDLETYTDQTEITGADVAKTIAGLPWKPSLVVIHSMNPSGAKTMEGILSGEGIQVLRIPISALTRWSPTRGDSDVNHSVLPRLI